MAETYTVTHRRIPWHPYRPGDPRPLGRNVHHDSRSLAYRYQQTGRELREVLHSRHIPILDQGNLGSCTGNAMTGALGSDPLFAALPQSVGGLPVVLDEAEAVRIYSEAEKIDGGPGYPPEDEGSSGLSVCQAAKTDGLISGYTHCLSLQDFLDALQDHAMLVGSHWYDSMDEPDSSGMVTISRGAQVRGDHEYLVRGVDPFAQTVWCDNSWGSGFGVGGSFGMGWGDLERLLAEQGDGTIPLPLTVPAPVPVPISPVPVPPGPVPANLADQALAAYAQGWISHRHTGDNARMASKLRTWMASKGF